MTAMMFKFWAVVTLALVSSVAASAESSLPAPAKSRQATKAAPATADALFKALPSMLPTFNADKLQKILDAFNARQDRLLEVSGYRQKGHSKITFSEAGKYVVFDNTQVEEAAVDSLNLGSEGVDKHESTFFSKQPMEEIAHLDGPTYSFANEELQLSVPAKTGCMGETPVGRLMVENIETNEGYFFDELSTHLLSFGISDATEPNVITFTTTDQEDVAIDENDPNDDHKHCDGFGWVKNVETTTEVRCNPDTHKCTMKVIAESITGEGCPSIGTCD
jgi:hypothetical protein